MKDRTITQGEPVKADTYVATSAGEAKKAIASRLAALAIPFQKLTAKQLSFEDLARATVFKVTVHGAVIPMAYDDLRAKLALPKPSLCGYMIDWQNCQWPNP